MILAFVGIGHYRGHCVSQTHLVDKLIFNEISSYNELYSENNYRCETLKGYACLLYTSDAADDMQCVDLGGRRIIKK